ncbi:MAG: hypothetical protein L6Q81_09170 [Bacteroidia bacterium]|nr:hypothetical protein [Bacteroidia bacterium]
MEKLIFEEQQYHGLNKHSMIRRLLLSVFCFVAYYWSENPKPVDVAMIHIGEYPGDVRYGELFFVLGLALVALSVILLFVPHMKIKVDNRIIRIKGKLAGRIVEIPIQSIVQVRKVTVRPTIFARPVFNLKIKGKIRFYTWGNEFVEIRDNAGEIYRIGTQKSGELVQILRSLLHTQRQNPEN